MIAAFLLGGLAAATLLLGHAVAGRGLSERTVGLVMAVGAGALISAIAYELVPESMMAAGWSAALSFALGSLAFFFGDWLVDHRGGADRKAIRAGSPRGSGAAIFIGTLLDNVPESLILGMSLSLGGSLPLAFFAAVFISNFPEGVAGSLNLEAAGQPRHQVRRMWLALVLVSALCAALGALLAETVPGATGLHAQAFAAGAMLTMLADAMMPEAFQHGGRTVGLFTVLGYLLAAGLSLAT